MSTTTYPLATLAAQVSSTGISAPQYSDIYNSEVASYKGIYGADTVLTPDTQDGQLIAIRSLAINDVNNLAITVYNSYIPAYAQGVGLSALVQTNGLTREAATNSTVVLEIGGEVGFEILNGVAKDTSGNLWNLPSSVTIPTSGSITVTATAQQSGNIAAIAGAVNGIYTIMSGWQTVTNPAAATPGTAVETDAALRVRQAASTALPSTGPLDAILAAVANSGGIGRYAIYNNTGNAADSNGVPGHSIAVVVEGGNVTTIATVIAQKKAPGTGTYGTTSVSWVDSAGAPNTINFFEVTEVPIYAQITIQPLNGYLSSTGTAAAAALAAFIQALAIGGQIYLNQLFGPAGLSGNTLASSFVITSLLIGTSPTELSAANIAIAFNAAATCSAANITVVTA